MTNVVEPRATVAVVRAPHSDSAADTVAVDQRARDDATDRRLVTPLQLQEQLAHLRMLRQPPQDADQGLAGRASRLNAVAVFRISLSSVDRK